VLSFFQGLYSLAAFSLVNNGNVSKNRYTIYKSKLSQPQKRTDFVYPFATHDFRRLRFRADTRRKRLADTRFISLSASASIIAIRETTELKLRLS
jgi:hypothetical protein